VCGSRPVVREPFPIAPGTSKGIQKRVMQPDDYFRFKMPKRVGLMGAHES